MPRNYKKKFGLQGKKNYDEIFLQRALTAVKQKRMPMRAAAEQYGVPYTTLNDHFHGRHQLKYGRPSVLDEKEESLLVDGLQLCANWGFPLKPIDIKQIVKQYLTKRGVTEPRFKDNLPGTDWFNGFMKRNPNLTMKLAENTKRVRAALSYEIVEDYFNNLKDVIKDVPSSNIINYDETNFVDDPGAVKVVLRKGTKHAHRAIDSTKKTSTTVMFAISGDGTMLPPYIVYKAKHSYVGWTEGGMEGARYNRTLSGWFDAAIFEDWFYSIILPYFKKLNGEKVLIGDNLSSHVTLSVIQECENNNIRFVLLPPASTHLLQPLDVAYFRPLKASWKKVLETWKLKNRGTLPKTLFPKLLKEAVENIGLKSQANSLAGFKACGISPFNPDAVLKKLPRRTDETIEPLWTDAIVNHLEQLRTGPTKTIKRGKKLNVSAGKSISTSDLMITDSIQGNKTIRSRRKQDTNESEEKQVDEIDISDIEPENQQDVEVAESVIASFRDDYEIGESSILTENLPEGTDCQSFLVKDYLIVKFETNRRDRYFLARIDSISDKEFTVNTMRKKDSKKDIFFVYPQIPDVSIISFEQIKRKVNLKREQRGRHSFHLQEEELSMLE